MSDGSNEMSVSDDSDDMYTSDCSERPDEKLAKDILRASWSIGTCDHGRSLDPG